jgi:hypothetical protein
MAKRLRVLQCHDFRMGLAGRLGVSFSKNFAIG